MQNLSFFPKKVAALRSWEFFLEHEINQPYFKDLEAFLLQQYQITDVYPPKSLIFSFMQRCPLEKVRVVIVGQDPYHGPGQAHGLSFSVPKGVPIPPSLRNIFKELQRDLNIPTPCHGYLESWAQQGVLLLNATLTVQKGLPRSHFGRGWESFTDHIIQFLAEKKSPVVFLLWGKSAQEKCLRVLSQVENHSHLVLKTTHPSPLSAYQGFLGCGHFSKTNHFLKKNNLEPINWAVT